MARRRYLIAYDISDERRLRRICKVMEEYGERLQYSVFLCDLSSMEHVRWRTRIHDEMNLAADSVIEIDLGALGSSAPIGVHGKARILPTHGASIV